MPTKFQKIKKTVRDCLNSHSHVTLPVKDCLELINCVDQAHKFIKFPSAANKTMVELALTILHKEDNGNEGATSLVSKRSYYPNR